MNKTNAILSIMLLSSLYACSTHKIKAEIKDSLEEISSGLSNKDTLNLKDRCNEEIYRFFSNESEEFQNTETLITYSKYFHGGRWKFIIEDSDAMVYQGTRSGLTGYTRRYYFKKKNDVWILDCYPNIPLKHTSVGNCSTHGF